MEKIVLEELVEELKIMNISFELEVQKLDGNLPAKDMMSQMISNMSKIKYRILDWLEEEMKEDDWFLDDIAELKKQIQIIDKYSCEVDEFIGKDKNDLELDKETFINYEAKYKDLTDRILKSYLTLDIIMDRISLTYKDEKVVKNIAAIMMSLQMLENKLTCEKMMLLLISAPIACNIDFDDETHSGFLSIAKNIVKKLFAVKTFAKQVNRIKVNGEKTLGGIDILKFVKEAAETGDIYTSEEVYNQLKELNKRIYRYVANKKNANIIKKSLKQFR